MSKILLKLICVTFLLYLFLGSAIAIQIMAYPFGFLLIYETINLIEKVSDYYGL